MQFPPQSNIEEHPSHIRIALTGGDLHLGRSFFAAWSALRDLEKVHVVLDGNFSIPFSHTCIRCEM